MANGTYGIKKPANITPDDVDIFYYYRPTRGSESSGLTGFVKIADPASVLYNSVRTDGKALSGMYSLRLPLEIFGKKGIYSIYIAPKEIELQIIDVSTLTGDYTNVRGVVFGVTDGEGNPTGIPTGNGELVGYRMEFLDSAGGNPTGEYRIITSNNKCEPVSQNVSSNAMQKGIRYRFNDSSDLMFCTVTPSTSASFKATAYPYIGKTGEYVRLVNTKFNPIMLEVEMVDHDIDTVSTMLEGAQLRNLDNGIITTFDKDGNIYHQAAYGNIVNPNRGIHTDFKIPYEGEYVSSEENKLEEIASQVRNG